MTTITADEVKAGDRIRVTERREASGARLAYDSVFEGVAETVSGAHIVFATRGPVARLRSQSGITVTIERLQTPLEKLAEVVRDEFSSPVELRTYAKNLRHDGNIFGAGILTAVADLDIWDE